MRWMSLAAGSAGEAEQLVAQITGHGLSDGAGVFRSGQTLFFSPVAVETLSSAALGAAEPCKQPDGREVELVCGPFADPAWYDQSLDDMVADLDMIELDESGMIGPDTDVDALRREVFGR